MIDVETKKDAILYGKNIVKTFLILALPIMFSSIIKTLHDMVDMYVVANIKDTKAIVDAQVAAISFTTPIISVVQGLAMGMMVAGTALMSQNIGAKRFIQAKRISGQLMLLCLIIGIIFNVLLYIMAPNIIRWMNAEEELFVYSVRYVRVRSFELSGLFIFFAFQATRQSMGILYHRLSSILFR
ncbi:MAG TPA: MATE family efflux transporter [Bacilli bacterium]|nr:MATE family efflux transporter [Bacilli bacterium]